MRHKRETENSSEAQRAVEQSLNVGGPGGPRRKVMRHLRKFLAGAGAAGVLPVVNCVCVDPAPPPPPACLQASALDASLGRQATWVQTDSGLAAQVILSVSQGLTLQGIRAVNGGNLVSEQTTATGITLISIPEPGTTEMDISVSSNCDDTPGVITVILDLSATPEAGNTIPVSVSGYAF